MNMTMRERIARAINPFAYYDGADQCYRDDALRTADAVLDALYEPDEGMLDAGNRAHAAWHIAGAPGRASIDVFAAMIDSARKQGRG